MLGVYLVQIYLANLKAGFKIASMIERRDKARLESLLGSFPVVGLVGARQVGKTTLARMLAEERPGRVIYLDLERPSDLARLAEPELYLRQHEERLVILDEIQRRPDLFPVLRPLVDARRRSGRFLLLGSASPELLRRSSESLAGRIAYHELGPFCLAEVGCEGNTADRLWCRGGFPVSFLAGSDERSFRWREAFVQTHLERDIPGFGIHVAPTVLRRFWQMIAHCHGQLWNASKVASSLGTTVPTVQRYLDILEHTFMVRRLSPFHANVKKRLVKAPKVYLRDSGLLHVLLGIRHLEDLIGHPSAGPSWEGWAMEQLLALLPDSWQSFFYRTRAGAEIDLVLLAPAVRRPIAVEFKWSAAPRPSKGFWLGIQDIQAEQGFVVYPGEEVYPLKENVTALPICAVERVVQT